MPTPWAMTVDTARPRGLAQFWALALGHEPSPDAGPFDLVHAR